MIALATRDDWQAIVLTLDDGGGAQSWTPAGTVADAYAAALDFEAWLLLTFAVTTAASWSSSTAGGAAATFALGSGGWTLTTNAHGTALLGAANGAGLSAVAWSGPVAGVVDSLLVELHGWWSSPTAQGDANGGGAVLPRAPGTASRRPRVTLYLSAAQAHRWAEVALALGTLRAAWLLDEIGVWRALTIGTTARKRMQPTVWALDVEALA